MPHYKAPDNSLHYLDSPLFEHVLPQGSVCITEEEAASLRPPIDPPGPSTPPVVSPFQARAALLQAGLLDDVETYMALPTTDPLEKLAWDRATEFRRGSPSIAAMQALLGVTDEQMDDLFRFASTIYA